MKSTFILATLVSTALAAPAPIVALPDDLEMCNLNLSFCFGSPQGYCKCEHENIRDVNERLEANGCHRRVQLSKGCRGINPPPPFKPMGTGTAMMPMPTGTGTATLPTGTGTPTLGDGTKACGRGQPNCPVGYTCREKWPGKVADAMYCFMDRPAHVPSLPPHGIPTPPADAEGQQCGGFMGIKCPAGYRCHMGRPMPIADQMGHCQKIGSLPRPQNPGIGEPIDVMPAVEAPVPAGTEPEGTMTTMDATMTAMATPDARLDQA